MRSGWAAGVLAISTSLKKPSALTFCFGAIDERAVVGVALGDQHPAADDAVESCGVAHHVDASDVNPRPLLDVELDVDRMLDRIRLVGRVYINEGETRRPGGESQIVGGRFDLLVFIDLTLLDWQQQAQNVRIQFL